MLRDCSACLEANPSEKVLQEPKADVCALGYLQYAFTFALKSN